MAFVCCTDSCGCPYALVTPIKAASHWSLKTSSESLESFPLGNPRALSKENLKALKQNDLQASNVTSNIEAAGPESLKTSRRESLKASSHESLKTSRRESLKASSHESLKTSSRESLKASSRESLKTSRCESLKASSHESLKTSRRESLKASSHESLKTSSRESLKASSQESLKASSHESLKTSSRESVKASSRESLKASSRESLKASSRESLKASSQKTLIASDHGSPKAPDHGSPKAPDHGSPKAPDLGSPKAPNSKPIVQQNIKGSTVNENVTSPETITPHKATSGIGQTASIMGGRDSRGIAVMQAEGVDREHASKEKKQSLTVYTPCAPEPSPSPEATCSKEPLERELAALQEALRAAGLPLLGSSTGPHASSTGPYSSTAGLHASSTGPHSSTAGLHASSTGPHSSTAGPHASTTGPHASTAGLQGRFKLDNEESHRGFSVAGKGIALSLHDAIREITTQELASVMKEVLEQERDAVLPDGVGAQDEVAHTGHETRSGWEWTTSSGHETNLGSHEVKSVEQDLCGDYSKHTVQPVGRSMKRAIPVANKVGKATRYLGLRGGWDLGPFGVHLFVVHLLI